MNESNTKRRASRGPGERASARFRNLLVPVDLTPISDRVIGRVSLLPLADDARVTLLHVVPPGLSVRDERNAERDARKTLAEEVKQVRRSLPKHVSVEPMVKVGAAAKEIAAAATAAKSELIVMGRGGGSALRDVFLGSTAERVIRHGKHPVMVVRLPPRAAYARPILALALDPCAHEVIHAALRVLPPPRPRFTVVHAFDSPFQRLAYPSLPHDAVQEMKDHRQLDATRKLANLLNKALAKVPLAETPGWTTHVREGTPRMIVQNAARKLEADLLVLGTRAHSGVAYFFLGTVAGDLLREARCDVLIVPPLRSRE